jgi:hypothetical protein
MRDGYMAKPTREGEIRTSRMCSRSVSRFHFISYGFIKLLFFKDERVNIRKALKIRPRYSSRYLLMHIGY